MSTGSIIGTQVIGGNLIIGSDSSLVKVIFNVPFGGKVQMKTHAAYTGSEWNQQTFVVSTTGATATVIASIPVPVGYAVSIRGHILGMQDDATDASTYTCIGCATNAAATTAMKGTALYQVVESNASCDFTITANDTTDAIEAKVTGIAAENYAWVASLEWMSVKTSA